MTQSKILDALQVINALREEGADTKEKMLDALQDGELLAHLGFNDKHKEAVENAYELTYQNMSAQQIVNKVRGAGLKTRSGILEVLNEEAFLDAHGIAGGDALEAAKDIVRHGLTCIRLNDTGMVKLYTFLCQHYKNAHMVGDTSLAIFAGEIEDSHAAGNSARLEIPGMYTNSGRPEELHLDTPCYDEYLMEE